MHVFKKNENEYIKKINKKLISNLKKSGLIGEKDDVLDFGCGTGIWEAKKSSKDQIFFHELYLYDINPENREYCKKKYHEFNVLDDIKQDFFVDKILINSVIQYIKKNDLKKLLLKFYFMLRKDGIIIISDIPKYPRIIEFILTFFGDFDLFKIQVKQVTNSKYRKTDYYTHSLKDLISEEHFEYKEFKNMDNNKNRYSIILKKIDFTTDT